MRHSPIDRSCFLIAVGGFLVGLLVFKWVPNPISLLDGPRYVKNPAGFVFRNHSILPDRPTLTIEGELVNTRDFAWKDVAVVASIYAGRAYMTYCTKDLPDVGGQAMRKFVLVCRETAGSGLPKNISYELAVAKAARE